MARYRILEVEQGGHWGPFGVGYESEGRILLFTPPWRGPRILKVASLDELGTEHLLGPRSRWGAIQTASEPLPHPIELLRKHKRGEDGPPTEEQVKLLRKWGRNATLGGPGIAASVEPPS